MMKKIIFALTLLVTILSGQESQAQFKIVGYIPNYRDLTAFSNSFDFARVTHLNIAFKNPTSSAGALQAFSSSEAYLVSTAHSHGVKVLISLGGASTGNSGTLQNNYFTLMSPANRSNFSSIIKQYILANNLDGVDVDIEGSGINSDYAGFVQVLADSIHPTGKLVTAALSQGYGGYNVHPVTFPYFDWINIMAYDACALNWCTTPANHSTYQFAVDNLNYWKGQGLPQEKAILGVPFYGYGFNNYASTYAVPFSQIATNFPNNTYDDQAANIIYYNGLATIYNKTSLAVASGGGIMIWELSLDAAGDNSLLKVIVEKATGYRLTGTTSSTEDKNLFVYPNPSSGIFTLEGIDLKNTKTEVYNAMGEKIITTMENNEVNLGNAPKGIYYLHLIKQDKVTLQKIVVQ